MRSFVYKVFKVIESEGVRFYFSKNAYDEMMKDAERYNSTLPIEFMDYLMYCTDFEVI